MQWYQLGRMILGLLALILFGGLLMGIGLSTRGWKGPAGGNFNGKTFRNPSPMAGHGPISLFRWMSSRKPGTWQPWREIQADRPPERSQSLRITWVNHASFLIQVGGVNLLVDPIWSKHCSPLPVGRLKRHHAPGVALSDLPPIDAVLISHNHYDHLDVDTLRQLARKGAGTFITGLGNGEVLRKNGIAAQEANWWDSIEVVGEGTNRVRVHLVPAQHFSARGILDRNKNLWCGFVIEHKDEGRVYHTGDTAWGEHFADIASRLGEIRVALLPIGAFRPRWFMSPVHMGPEEVPAVQDALGHPLVIPMHFGCFRLGDDGELEALEALQEIWSKQERDPQRLAVLEPGGVWPQTQ